MYIISTSCQGDLRNTKGDGEAFCLGAKEAKIKRGTLVSCQTQAQLPQHFLTFHKELHGRNLVG